MDFDVPERHCAIMEGVGGLLFAVARAAAAISMVSNQEQSSGELKVGQIFIILWL